MRMSAAVFLEVHSFLVAGKLAMGFGLWSVNEEMRKRTLTESTRYMIMGNILNNIGLSLCNHLVMHLAVMHSTAILTNASDKS